MTPRPDSSIAAARIAAAGHRRIPRMGSGETWQKMSILDSFAAGSAAFLARCDCDSFSDRQARQYVSAMRRYIDAMRSPTSNSGKFFASCIPEGAPDGKSAPPWQHIAAMHPKRAGFGKICAPCIRKAPQTAFRECMARRSCQGGALFAALTPRIMHGARILPSLASEREGVGAGKNDHSTAERERVGADRKTPAFGA